jgi:transposase-like protein
MDCEHDLCEKCAYQIFDTNSRNINIIKKHKQSCYLSCPLCRQDSIFKIRERPVYYFDNMIKLSSITDTMDYILTLYKSNDLITYIPYIMIMYPDGDTFIVDPATKYIYSA